MNEWLYWCPVLDIFSKYCRGQLGCKQLFTRLRLSASHKLDSILIHPYPSLVFPVVSCGVVVSGKVRGIDFFSD